MIDTYELAQETKKCLFLHCVVRVRSFHQLAWCSILKPSEFGGSLHCLFSQVPSLFSVVTPRHPVQCRGLYLFSPRLSDGKLWPLDLDSSLMNRHTSTSKSLSSSMSPISPILILIVTSHTRRTCWFGLERRSRARALVNFPGRGLKESSSWC